jgi:transcription initiation factor TFIIH subunit 1
MASTGKNIRPNLKGIDGGEKVVNQLMGPTTKALEKAIAQYKKAVAEEKGERAPGM